MNIYGLQKMTLLDYPGHVACTVFTGGCDFRCPFCHNFELACHRAEVLMEEEKFLEFLGKRKGLLDGVAITGGEPCLNKGLPELMEKIHSLGFAVKLDTNGYHPAMLERVLQGGLADYVAMDIKNSPEKYAQTCGVERIDMGMIRESIAMLLQGDAEYEFRTTVVDEFHEETDFKAMGEMIQGAGRYFLQSFTDRDSVPFGNLHAPGKEKMLRYAQVVRPYVEDVQLRGVELLHISRKK